MSTISDDIQPRPTRLHAPDRVALTAVSLAMLLPGIASVSLTDRDEGWYAQVSREMVTTGDWLVPRYLGEPWIAKPPLLYWCVAASYSVFGIKVWAARLVSVLALVGVVHLLASLASELYGRRAALFAAVSFVTAGLTAIVGKMLLTDGVLLLCCMAAIVCLWRFAAGRSTFPAAALFWTFVGLGILAKGPAILVFVGAFGLGILARPGHRHRVFSWRLWILSPLAALIAAPWYVYIASQAGGTLVQQFFWYEILSRLAGTPHGHGGPPGYYVLLSLAGWLPWTALVPGAVLERWQSRRRDPHAWLLLVWCFLPWVVLELIRSKLPHYILPCYVPLAIMLGRMWDEGLKRPPDRTQRAVLGIWAGVLIAIGTGTILSGVAWHPLPWTWGAVAAGGTLALGFLVVGAFALRRRLKRAWLVAVSTTVVFHLLLGEVLLPGFEPFRLSRNAAHALNLARKPGDETVVCSYGEPSTFFYLDSPAQFVQPKQLEDALRASRHAVTVLLPASELPRIQAAFPRAERVTEVSGFNYVNGQRVELIVVRIPRK